MELPTAAAAAAVATVSATEATAAVFTRNHGLCFVHRQRTAIEACAMKFLDCFSSFCIVGHFHEAEAFAAS